MTKIPTHLIHSIWPEQEFSSAELVQLQGYLGQPVVKKYLLHMVALSIQAIGTGGMQVGQSPTEYMIEEASVKGGLDVLDKLMKFEYPAQAGDSDSQPVES